MSRRPRRAPALSPDQRRDAIVDATLPLLRLGREASTKEIACAAGIAEGTIFRAFGSKQHLIEAAMARALDPGDFLEDLEAIDLSAPVAQRLTEAVELLRSRMSDLHAVMNAVGLSGPPPAEVIHRWHEVTITGLTRLLADEPGLRIPPASAAHLLRMLSWALTHPYLSTGRQLTPAQIVDVLLHGVLADPDSPEGS